MTTTTQPTVSLTLVHPDAAHAREALRAYFTDIVGRYYGRPATEVEVDSALADHPSDDLELPNGLFWVAFNGTAVVGCAGLRLLPAGVGEVTRVFVADAARRQGIAARLLDAVETAARTHCVSRLRLDTRHDLVEARMLYLKHSYVEVPAFNDSPYAAHWFVKTLT